MTITLATLYFQTGSRTAPQPQALSPSHEHAYTLYPSSLPISYADITACEGLNYIVEFNLKATNINKFIVRKYCPNNTGFDNTHTVEDNICSVCGDVTVRTSFRLPCIATSTTTRGAQVQTP